MKNLFNKPEVKLITYEDEFEKVTVKYIYDKSGLLISSEEIERIILVIKPKEYKPAYVFIAINDEVKNYFQKEIEEVIQNLKSRNFYKINYLGNKIMENSDYISFENINLSKIFEEIQKDDCDIFIFTSYINITLPFKHNWFIYSLNYKEINQFNVKILKFKK